ncbi:Maf family protein [Nannocystis radixulma]|uniref:dTTP/UTP pyrophosphatase n=1 Tax=Nannocystis radixulma TaxID=2995305 RepID=A0ABT5BJF7_9BACT|nr:Maf family protein [Nannocystis radixulma]MDC0674289.1 Maf family protein [Nannocystis radixulma]
MSGQPQPSSTLVLASASPRRAELLRSAGIAFTRAPVDCDETWFPDEPPPRYVERVARAKAELAFRPGVVVLAADTTVWLEGQIEPLAKAADRAEAAAMLTRLAGRSHFTTTAVAVADARGPEVRWHPFAVTTTVWFRPLTPAQIDRYLDTEEWRDKAGAYGIQGAAAGLVRRIEGSYTNVVGLPLAEVVELVETLALG